MTCRETINRRAWIGAIGGFLALAPIPVIAGNDAPVGSVPSSNDHFELDAGNGEIVELVAPDGHVHDVPVEVAHDETVEVTPDGLLVSEPVTYGPTLPHEILDFRYGASSTGPGEIASEAPPESEAYSLHSNAGADLTIYLDFTGHTTTGTSWNSGSRPDSFTSVPYEPSRASNTASYIVKIWELVAEDFAPFDVNVTTEEPTLARLRRDSNDDAEYGIRVVISETDEWYGSSGGVAYINSMRWRDFPGEDRTPAFVFSDNLGGGYWKYVAEAASHEVGHTLGLYHDGINELDYYSGHNDPSGSSWAPIMGVGYNANHTQWSKGEYPGATQTQDDLAIIFERLGARNAGAPAGPVAIGHDETASGSLDTGGATAEFSIAVGDGPLAIDIDPTISNGNLFASAQLLDGSTLVASSTAERPRGWSLGFDENVTQGIYTLRVTSTGWLTAADGFTPYGSLGEFTVKVAGAEPDDSGPTTTDPTTTTTTPTTTTTTTVPVTTTTTSTTATTTTTTTTPPTTAPPTTTPPTTTTPTTTTTNPPPPPPEVDPGDLLTPITPVRLLDTRFGTGGARRVAAGSTTRVAVNDHPSISASATSAVLNVVAVDPAAAGFLQITPCLDVPADKRTASVAFGAAATIGNSTIAKLDDSGDVCVFSLVATDIVLDATGWIGPDGQSGLHVDTPTRVVDTRNGTGLDGPLVAARTTRIELDGFVPDGSTAAAVNLTAVDAAGPGFITAFPCSANRPKASSLNFDDRVNRSNNAVVALDGDSSFCIFSPTATDIVVDLNGSFGDNGLEFVAADPVRLLDSRSGRRTLAPKSSVDFRVPAAPDGHEAAAASMVITVVDHAAPGFVTSWACGKRPLAAAVVAVPGEANANGSLADLTTDARSCLFTSGAANLVVDFSGWWV